MSQDYFNLTAENLEVEHLCCAIAGKKHQCGVDAKKAWLSERLLEGHVFRKLDERGKVFIEYAPLETAWTPVVGENYLYIYCLWVAGKFKGLGHAKNLLNYCIEDAKTRGKSGVCILSSKKKKPFLSDKKFMVKHGFEVVDTIDDYELLALSFDGSKPCFAPRAQRQSIANEKLTIYYGMQCPYIPNCIEQIENYCIKNRIPFELISVDSLEKAKSVPGIFNNWAVFCNGQFETVHLLNEGCLEKMLAEKET
jgi:ribosomal protein S18 acetylase RimI-like enzyme